MLKTLSQRMDKISSGQVTLAATLVFLLFTALVLPAMGRNPSGGGDAPIPDISLFYTPQELYAMAEAYGAAGRQAYIQARFTFDVVWPLIYTAFLVTSLSWLARRAFKREDRGTQGNLPLNDNRWRLINLLPLLGMALDFAENISTSLVMARYPALTPLAAALAPWFTLTKWLVLGGCFVLLVGVGFFLLIQILRRK